MLIEEKQMNAIRRRLIKKECPYCHGTFYTDNVNRRFCSASHRVLYSRSRKNGNEDLFESNEEAEIFENNFLNINDMNTEQLVKIIEEKNSLNLRYELLKKDYEILKNECEQLREENERLTEENDRIDDIEEEAKQFEGLGKKCQALEDENESLKDEIEILKNERGCAGENADFFEAELKKYQIALLVYRSIVKNITPTITDMKKIDEDIDLQVADNFKVDGYSVTRKAGEETYKITKP
jgi:DNA repair exonuclease SbcCD ATPase subunit